MNLVMLLDDDPDFLTLVSQILLKHGMKAVSFQKSADFLKALTSRQASEVKLCLIDLNLGFNEEGLTVIQSIRNSGNNTLPLLILSGANDAKIIAHAIELGANDYITKPLDKAVLISKLTQFIDPAALDSPILGIPMSQPMTNEEGVVTLEFQIKEIDELGLTISGPHLPKKGSTFSWVGSLSEEILGSSQAYHLTVTDTWVEVTPESYGAYLEFNTNDRALLQSVKEWLLKKSS